MNLTLLIAACSLTAALIAFEHVAAALFRWGVRPGGIIARYVAGCIAILAGLALLLPPWELALVFAVMTSAGAATVTMYALTTRRRTTPEIDYWKERALAAEAHIDNMGGQDGGH